MYKHKIRFTIGNKKAELSGKINFQDWLMGMSENREGKVCLK